MIESTVALCLLFTLVATVTDVRRHTIYNWNTYSGMVVAFVVRGFAGGDALIDGIEGFAACGGVMLLCFVLFDVGGGDVKLLAMTGSFLGIQSGIEVMLWTFVIGSMAAVVIVIWQTGFWQLVYGTVRHMALTLKARGRVPLEEQEKVGLTRPLYLAPASLIGLLIVEGQSLWNQIAG